MFRFLKALFLVFILIVPALAQNTSDVDYIPTLDDNSKAVLNDNLRRTNRRLMLLEGGIPLTTGVTGILPLANGGTGQALSDPGADRIIFWDNSETKVDFLTAGSGLVISGTTITSQHFEVFTADDTWTAPVGVTKVYLTMIGGGGSGGTAGASDGDTGGGSAGGLLVNYPYTVTPGNSYDVDVGAAGVDSIFDSTITAPAGNSGTTTSAGVSPSGDATVSGPGDTCIKQGNGYYNVGDGGGAGGSSVFGVGGAARGSYGAGNAASGYGAGGGGANGSGGAGVSGGEGSPGLIIIAY